VKSSHRFLCRSKNVFANARHEENARFLWQVEHLEIITSSSTCRLRCPWVEGRSKHDRWRWLRRLTWCVLPFVGDDSLSVWHKRSQPVLQYPPENLPLVGWRDPYIFEVGGKGKEWGMLLGSGLKGKGGAVLIYRSASLHEGPILLEACLRQV